MFILSFCFSTSAVFVILHYSLTALTGNVLKYVSSYSNFVRQAHFEEEVMLNQDTKFGVHIFERDEIIKLHISKL